MDKPYSVPALAERWSVSVWAIYGLLRDGRLQGFKLGGKLWRISAGEVERWENGGATGSGPIGSDNSTEKPSRRGGRTPGAEGFDSKSERKLRGELRLIGSLASDKP